MRTFIALGSNLGDRLANLRAGRDFLLALHQGPASAAVSPVYETSPVDCPPGSAAFLNAVVALDTPLAPPALLARLTGFERACGRPDVRARHSPRPLDLDILCCGDLVLDTPSLTLPHPRLAARRFVLRPLADLCPDLVLPGQSRTVAELLTRLPAEPAAHLQTSAW